MLTGVYVLWCEERMVHIFHALEKAQKYYPNQDWEDVDSDLEWCSYPYKITFEIVQ